MTSTSPARIVHPSTSLPSNPLPPVLKLGLHRVTYELRRYIRKPDAWFFTFAFPIVLLGIFSLAFDGQDLGGGVTGASYYLPAMLASGILTIGTQNLGIHMAEERYDDTRKRLAGTPLSPASYLMGKIGQVFITGAIQAALLVLIAHFVFDVALPTDNHRWVTFAWVLFAGLVTSTIVGIAVSQLPRSARSASSVVTPVVLVLQFVSGVFLPFSLMPQWLQHAAGIFPLRWLAQGMRSVFLPDSMASLEIGGSWNLGGIALVLGLWLVLGTMVARAMFRWIPRG